MSLALGLPTALLGATAVAMAFAPAQLRLLEYHALPPWPVALALGLYAAAAIGTRHWRRRLPAHALLVGILLAAHLLAQAQPLGDVTTWREWAKRDVVGASELLANALYRLVQRTCGTSGLDFVAPGAGALLGLVLLGFVERTLVAAWPRRAATIRLLGAAALAGGGWQAVCFRGYLENTLPSLPFLLLGLGALARHAAPHGPRGALLAGSCWLAVAGLVHGSATASWPVILLAIAWRRAGAGAGAGGAVREAGWAAAVIAGTIAAALALLLAAGFALHIGHVDGGGDGRHFVPLHRDGHGFWYEFGLFDLAHAADVGNILAFASPLGLAAAGLLWSARWRRAALAAVRRQPVLAFAAMGATSCTAIYYFDLRFPSDLDLMVALSAPLAPFLLQIAARAPRRWRPWLWTSMAANAAATWAVIAALLAADPRSPSAADDLLRVNRRAGEVVLRRGEMVFLGLAPPPGGAAPFAFSVYAYRGTPPAGSGRVPREDGLAFAPPGAPGADPARTLLVIDPQQLGALGHLAPPLAEPWLAKAPAGVAELGVLTIQALVRDARGRTTASNVVTVRPR